MINPPTTFAASAWHLAQRGWRPFPGHQETKRPAMVGWNGLNNSQWDYDDLEACITDYNPQESFCCCLAVQPEIIAVDIDILDSTHASFANKLADEILGPTPLLRIGLHPKSLRVFRSNLGIRSKKLHPIEIFAGSGQVIAFGWHQKARGPYQWPKASPLDLCPDSEEIPLLSPATLDQFFYEFFKVLPRQVILSHSDSNPVVQTIGDRLRMLTIMQGNWERAAARILSEAVEGCRNETAWIVVASATGRGISEETIYRLFETHFTGWDGFSREELTSAIERTRNQPRPPLRFYSKS